MKNISRIRLERSCGTVPTDWIKIVPSRSGFERLEASFSGHGYEPHRHDGYAIGYTLHGAQCFKYRGATVCSTAGQIFVLHPDEIHDGYAGTAAGFRYRSFFIDPRLIQDALGGPPCPLPFVRGAVSNDTRLHRAVLTALGQFELPLEDIEFDQIVLDVADALSIVDSSTGQKELSKFDWRAVWDARDFIEANALEIIASEQLEALTGLTRYTLARHFRACFGTSPYRYLVMRRLNRARDFIQRGDALAGIAASCGFADQSHMSRHFKKAYGVTPGRWAALAKSSV